MADPSRALSACRARTWLQKKARKLTHCKEPAMRWTDRGEATNNQHEFAGQQERDLLHSGASYSSAAHCKSQRCLHLFVTRKSVPATKKISEC